MFLFYHTQQNEKNYRYYKGKLFENALSKYLKKSGYSVEIRCKHNSLEYDLEGINDTTRQKIVGEAKAHEEAIDGATVSSFVGKLLPLGLIQKEVFGLFLSTSSITAEAEDYMSKIEGLGVRVISGKMMYENLIETLELPKEERLGKKINAMDYNPLFYHLLLTDIGEYVVVVWSGKDTITASYFAVFDKNENIVSDVKFLDNLVRFVKELSALSYIKATKEKGQELNREIPFGISYGKTWTDYRLPAAPNFYIGRGELIDQILNFISEDSEDDTHIIQIKSRSGVGKSSTLALLVEKFEKIGYNVEIHDVRDIKSILDVYSVIFRFTKVQSMPQDFLEVEESLKKLSDATEISVFVVDQFESTFLRPEIFQAYESIANIISKLNKKIYFCLARKNDQITTYDNSLISLNRLNAISKNYELRDFSIDESKLLLENISKNANKNISLEVLAYVLEFAQGFPWLLKRTMAHIIKLTSGSNISQKDLISTGLMLSDLFEEELEGLEELEKEYIVRISSKLPADFHELQRMFDEDPLLPKLLDKFTQMRLLRLSGSTYDTYNDVFKEYLVYKKLPEFRHQYLFRQAVNPVVKFFAKIVFKNRFTLEQLSKSMKTSQKTMGNYLKECRNLNLVKRDDKYWEVPVNVKDIYSQGFLGEYVRRQVLANDLVSNFISLITKKEMSVLEIPQFLQQQFPFVEAVNSTWELYANLFEMWITATKIVYLENGLIKYNLGYSENDIKRLGNLQNVVYGKRNHGEVFLPSASWGYVEKCYMTLKSGKIPNSGEERKIYLDFNRIGIVDKIKKIESFDEFVQYLKNNYLQTPEYIKIWNAAKNQKGIIQAVAEIAGSDISQTTLEWRTKKIINWGKGLGLIPNKRYKYERTDDNQILMNFE